MNQDVWCMQVSWALYQYKDLINFEIILTSLEPKAKALDGHLTPAHNTNAIKSSVENIYLYEKLLIDHN